jgi:DNA (cytosine-5)-methyltransferase 1
MSVRYRSFRFIDLFSGIGGFHLALSTIGGKCVMASDIDEAANDSYKVNFGIEPLGDIKQIDANTIPNFDLLCGGFPCQSFSQIGQKGGLDDDRGALIYDVVRILEAKSPKAFILENVKGLTTHDKGRTFKFIIQLLEEAGYKVKHKLITATDFNLPQIRNRVFIVGVRKDIGIEFDYPNPLKRTLTLDQVMGGQTERQYAFTIRCGGRRSGIDNKFNWDCYRVDGQIRYITVQECLALQGFPRDLVLAGNSDKKYRLVGNSVPVNIVREIGRQLIKQGII